VVNNTDNLQSSHAFEVSAISGSSLYRNSDFLKTSFVHVKGANGQKDKGVACALQSSTL
jgi:hypothetical protein